jgi:hypothetical protein
MHKDILDYFVYDDKNEGPVFSKLRPVDYTKSIRIDVNPWMWEPHNHA